MSRTFLLVPLAILALAGCHRADGDAWAASSDVERLHAAVRGLTDVMARDTLSPREVARVYAYASVAAYEAMRPARRGYLSLAGQLQALDPLPAPPPAGTMSWGLAGIRAYLAVGAALSPSRRRVDSLRTALEASYRSALEAPDFARSTAYGDTVAKHILAWVQDGRDIRPRPAPTVAVPVTVGEGPLGPAGARDTTELRWVNARPLALDSAGQFPAAPPPAFDTTRGSPLMRLAQEVLDVSRRLTPEQRAIAAFWDGNPQVIQRPGHAASATTRISPGGHWMGIVAIAARQARAGPLRAAAAYARTAIAVDDAFLAGWTGQEGRERVARPETVIPAHLDPAWRPLVPPPPRPEYVSGHGMVSSAAAAVLTDEFGPGFRFVDSAVVRFGLPPRTFDSFVAAAEEAAVSRLYGGVRFRTAVEEGARMGRLIGAFEVRRVRTRGGPTMVAETR